MDYLVMDLYNGKMIMYAPYVFMWIYALMIFWVTIITCGTRIGMFYGL